MNTVATFVFAVYVGLVFLLAFRDAQTQLPDQFMIAGRRVGWFPTMAAIVGNLRDGAGLAAWMVLGVAFGFGALWLTVGLALGLLILALFAPRIRSFAEQRDIISVSQMLHTSVGPQTARLSALFIAGTALLYGAVQVNVAGRVLGSLFSIGTPWAVVLTTAVVGGYLLVGGYKTTITTGVLQWFIIMVIVILPWLIPERPIDIRSIHGFGSPPVPIAVGFLGISLLVVLSSADIWQLIFSSASSNEARKGFLFSVPIYFLISVGMILFSAAVQANAPSGTAPDQSFFSLFDAGTVPPIIASVVGVFVAADVMSTLDSQVFLFTSTLVREVLPRKEGSDSRRMETVTRALIFCTMLVLTLIAVWISDLVEFLFGAVTLATTLAPVLVLTLLADAKPHRHADRIILLGLLVSGSVYIYLFASGAFDNLLFTLIPAAISFVFAGVAFALARRTGAREFDAPIS